MLLQLYTASPIAEIWSGAEDASHASWVGEPATVLPRGIYSRGGREVFRCRGDGDCIYVSEKQSFFKITEYRIGILTGRII